MSECLQVAGIDLRVSRGLDVRPELLEVRLHGADEGLAVRPECLDVGPERVAPVAGVGGDLRQVGEERVVRLRDVALELGQVGLDHACLIGRGGGGRGNRRGERDRCGGEEGCELHGRSIGASGQRGIRPA